MHILGKREISPKKDSAELVPDSSNPGTLISGSRTQIFIENIASDNYDLRYMHIFEGLIKKRDSKISLSDFSIPRFPDSWI